MRIAVDIKGLDDATAGIVERFSAKRIQSVAASALTKVAVEARAAVQDEMRRALDRPTPYTLGSVRFKAATLDSLTSEVFVSTARGVRDPSPAVVLKPQVEGGGRGMKGLELALRSIGVLPVGWYVTPGAGARLDSYGNVSRGLITQVVTQLRRQVQVGPKDARRIGRTVRAAGGVIFAVKPGGKMGPGVYIADAIGRNVTPLFKFVNRATYQVRLPFAEIISRKVQQSLPAYVAQAFGESVGKTAGGAGSKVIR